MKNEISKTFRDAVLYGTGFMKDGKNVPVNEVYTELEKPVTDDLVKRLREIGQWRLSQGAESTCLIAADRIEKQEWYLAEAQKCLDAGDYEGAIIICRAALGESKDG